MNIETVEGNIGLPETLPAALRGVECVIQCAQFEGHPVENSRRGRTYFNVDALGTENLARAAKESGVKYFLYISGAGTDGKRKEPWFKAKWYAEQSIHAVGLPATILRPSIIYGPRDRTISRMIRMARRIPFFPMIGWGKNRVRPLFINDLAAIVVRCLETISGRDRVFEAGGPEEIPFREMLRRVFRAAGKRRGLLPIPKFLVKLASWPLKILPNPPMTPKAVDFVTMDISVNITPLLEAFPDLKLATLEEGLKTYL